MKNSGLRIEERGLGIPAVGGWFRFIAMALFLIAMAGCDYMPFGYTAVKDIVAAPAGFEGREVKLKGKAKDVTRLLGRTSYNLQDATGEITVVTEGNLPAENSDVALTGTVKSAMIVGGSAVGLRVEETRRLR